MKEVKLLILFIVLALFGTLFFSINSVLAGSSYTVGPGEQYTKLEDAISAANNDPGSTVIVKAGDYDINPMCTAYPDGYIKITAPMTIKGEGFPNIYSSVFDNSPNYSFISIDADNVKIEGLNIYGKRYLNWGIYVKKGADNFVLENCRLLPMSDETYSTAPSEAYDLLKPQIGSERGQDERYGLSVFFDNNSTGSAVKDCYFKHSLVSFYDPASFGVDITGNTFDSPMYEKNDIYYSGERKFYAIGGGNTNLSGINIKHNNFVNFDEYIIRFPLATGGKIDVSENFWDISTEKLADYIVGGKGEYNSFDIKSLAKAKYENSASTPELVILTKEDNLPTNKDITPASGALVVEPGQKITPATPFVSATGSGQPTIVWSISNSAVASIDEKTGEITGKTEGTAKIAAKIYIKEVDLSYSYTDVNNPAPFDTVKTKVITKEYEIDLKVLPKTKLEFDITVDNVPYKNKTLNNLTLTDPNGRVVFNGSKTTDANGKITFTANELTTQNILTNLPGDYKLSIPETNQYYSGSGIDNNKDSISGKINLSPKSTYVTPTPTTSPDTSPTPTSSPTPSTTPSPSVTPTPSTIPTSTPTPTVTPEIIEEPYIYGYPDGLIRPQGNLTRAELAQLIYNLFYDGESELTKVLYPDVINTAWYYKAICFAGNNDYMIGYPNGKFEPNKYITRAEFAKVFSLVLELEIPSNTEATAEIEKHWAKMYILSLKAVGALTGYEDGSIKPDQSITRAEACVIINKLLNRTNNFDKYKIFPDLVESFYAYKQMMNAANGYNYFE